MRGVGDSGEEGEEMSGSITSEKTVWCGLCCEWHQEAADTIRFFEKLIKAYGWKKTNKDGWICPDCAKKNKRK